MITSNLRKRANVRTAAVLLFAACSIFVIAFPRTSAEDGMGLPAIERFKVSIPPPPNEVRSGDYFEVVAEFDLPEGLHVYRDTTYFEWTEKQGANVVGTVYPVAKPLADPSGKTTDVLEGKFAVRQVLQATGKASDRIVLKGKLNIQGCDQSQCYPPETRDINFTLKTLEAAPGVQAPPVISESRPSRGSAVDVRYGSPPQKKEGGIFSQGGEFRWFDIILAFLFGILVSFTPCVLPMTPITSGIILAYAKPGKFNAFVASVIYVFAISIVFGVLGVIVGMAGGPVQSVLNSWYARGFIALIFLALALSMFGLFEIGLPSSVTSRAQALGGKTRKNVAGLFLFGIISAFIISPCVAGPTAFILLWIASKGDVLLGFLMMFVMAWGMGLLLIAAGTFTGLIPRSGPWMLYVKTAFGLIMLWAAVYFISPFLPDGVYYLGVGLLLIIGSVFMGGWDALTVESGFGARFRRALGLLMVFLGLFIGLGGLIKVTGLIYNYRQTTQSPAVSDPFTNGTKEDLDAALSSGQPVVLDFSASWCTLCKELEDYTFSDARVVEELKRFKAIRVDFDKETELVKRYNVPGPPRVAIFGSDGKERADLSFNGFKSADELLEILKRVK